jgi:hypothetical protein
MKNSRRRSFIGSSLACLASAPAALAGTAEPDQPPVDKAVDKAVAQCRESEEAFRLESQAVHGKALVARFGPGVVDTIQQTTVAGGKASMEAAPVPSRDLPAVKSLLWDRLPASIEWRVVESTPTRLRFEVTKCALAEAMRRHGAPELGYAYNCAYDLGFCAGLNPRLRFTRTKTLMMGDAVCDHTYELDETKS